MRSLASGGSGTSSSSRLSQAIAFALPIILLAYYALRGGSYENVVWQVEAIAIWLLLGVGLASGLLPRRRLHVGVLVTLAAALLLAAWAALALLWTESAERTFLEIGRIVHYGGILLAAWALLDRRTRVPAVYGLAVAAVGVSVAAAASRLVPAAFPTDVIRERIGVYRLNYPFDYWNALAAWAAMASAMALALSVHARRLWVRAAFLAAVPVCGLTIYLTYSRGGLISVAVALVAVFAMSSRRRVVAVYAFAALVATAAAVGAARANPAIARGQVGSLAPGEGAGETALVLLAGMLICIAAAAVVGGVQRQDRVLPRLAFSRRVGEVTATIGRRGRLAAGIVLVLAVIAGLAIGGDSLARVSEELRDVPGIATGSGEDPSERLVNAESSRPSHWAAALEAFWANPLTGTGPGTYEFWWNRGGGETFARDAHSLYLEHLAEGGLPGFLLILVLIGSLVVLAVRGRARWNDADSFGAPVAAAAAVIVFAVHAALDWLWEVPAVTALALLCAAVASAPTEDRHRPSALVRTAAAAATLVACLVQLPALASTLRVEDSQAAFRAGEPEAAEEAAEEAIDLEPWAASPYVQRALLAEADGRLDEARGYVESAIENEPTNWVHWELLARIEEASEEPQAATAAMEEARRLRPVVPSFRSPSG